MKRFILTFLIASILGFAKANNAQVNTNYVSEKMGKGYFTMSESGSISDLLISSSDYPGVIRAFNDLQEDINKITGSRPQLYFDKVSGSKSVIIAGTVGKSELIDQLIAKKIIDPAKLEGKWEKFIIQTVNKPFPDIEQALVIAGSDKRGTIYGIYDVSKKIGVSPWYYWADVPFQKKQSIYIKPGTYTDGEPAVKYRGIFINDEAPCLRNWAKQQFGGFNHKFYEKVFELLLRNKANYIWPAMWLPTMFYIDDPINPKVADEYGIVVSTSHHEPFTRAHNEWSIKENGEWNYETNKEALQKYWRGGIERIKDYETVITVGMRGDGDAQMSEGTAVNLLQTIINDQRKIIENVTNKPASETPQVWALYKEVQDYYNEGMRVDNDIIVLFSDDNWGNIRYLPKKEDRNDNSKYGMYYHFEYVGGPRSYKWQNSTQIERVWEQMKLTYEHGVKDLWIVNVGDIKPMELPVSFFMDYAWNPNSIQASDLPVYYEEWSKQQFGKENAKEIAELLSLYTKYNARRTPEMLDPGTYSIENYREADRIIDEYNKLSERSTKVYNRLYENQKSAYYQLVHYPIISCANINEMYVAAGKNQYYGIIGASSANYYANRVKELFEKDAELTNYFHNELAGGKWNQMMSQTHIGYTYWNHPPLNRMPAISYVQIAKPAELGFLLEYGEKPAWGWLDLEADWAFSETLPLFDPVNDQDYYIDIINRGEENLSYSIKAKQDWITLSKGEGTIQFNEKVYVRIDWNIAPKENATGEIIIYGAGSEYSIKVPISNNLPSLSGFVENNGVIAFEAANFTRKVDHEKIQWQVVPNLGRTNSSVIVEPVTANSQKLDEKTPMVEYEFSVFQAGELTVEAFLSPTQDYKRQGGLKYAISIDNEEPQIVNINLGEEMPDWKFASWWEKSVGDHIKIRTSKHKVDKAGKHLLKVWMIDSGIVFQRFVIDAGGKKSSYLGAPESNYIKTDQYDPY